MHASSHFRSFLSDSGFKQLVAQPTHTITYSTLFSLHITSRDVEALPSPSTSDHWTVLFEVCASGHCLFLISKTDILSVDYATLNRRSQDVAWFRLPETYVSTSDICRGFYLVVPLYMTTLQPSPTKIQIEKRILSQWWSPNADLGKCEVTAYF